MIFMPIQGKAYFGKPLYEHDSRKHQVGLGWGMDKNGHVSINPSRIHPENFLDF